MKRRRIVGNCTVNNVGGVYGPLAIRKTASDRIKRYANGPFVVGSSNLKHDALTTHEKSEGHKYDVEITALQGTSH